VLPVFISRADGRHPRRHGRGRQRKRCARRRLGRGPDGLLFAATYPERTQALVNYGSLPRFARGPGFPWREPKHEILAAYEEAAQVWGTERSARTMLEEQGEVATPELVE
jgi:hypothetical protein